MFGGIYLAKITFGTDGWRSHIADDFTYSNVMLVTQAICEYVNKNGKGKGVFIGYDNRFLSPEFADCCAKVLLANGIKVYMTKSATPTPVTAFGVVHYNLDGAIMLTASHNPSTYHGIKFIPQYGGPANKRITDEIVKYVEELETSQDVLSIEDLSGATYVEPKQEYTKSILKLIDVEIIKAAKPKVLVNPMFGAGIGYTEDILRNLGCEVKCINNYKDVLFGGRLPDPNIKNMPDLMEIMKNEDFLLGLATDGDADRFGIIDNELNFISPNQVLYLLMHYLIKTRGYNTCVSRTVATTYMLDRIGQKYGIEIIETPVGFKYIAEGFMQKDAFLGGEESGGLSIKGHVPEKDGILACLLVLEMVCKLQKNPTQIMEDLKSEIGYLYSGRLDIHCSQSDKERVLSLLKEYSPIKIANQNVVKKVTIDGLKLIMDDGSWTLIRPSGTESLFRIYAEGNSEVQVKEIHEKIKSDIGL